MPLYTEYIDIPKCNPLRWLKYNDNTKDDFFVNSISDFEQPESYCQLFQQTDSIITQVRLLKSFVSSYKMEIVNEYLAVVQTASSSVIYDDGTYLYVQFAVVPSTLNGYYFGKLSFEFTDATITRGDVYYSEPLNIRATHENTILIGYRHKTNDFGVIFQRKLIGITPARRIATTPQSTALFYLRVHGGVWEADKGTASDDVMYINDSHDVTLLHSVPYNLQVLKFGDARGVPVWLYDKIVRAWACTYVQVDGQYYTKNEGATVEKEAVERYPMVTGSLEILPAENDYSDTYSAVVTKKPTGIGFDVIGISFRIN